MYTLLYLDARIYNTHMNINGYDLCVHLFIQAYVHMCIPKCLYGKVHMWKISTAKGANTCHRVPRLHRTLLGGFHNQGKAFGWDPNNSHQLHIWMSLTSVSVSILRGKLLPEANNQNDGPDYPSEALQQLGFCEFAAALLYYNYVPLPYWLRLQWDIAKHWGCIQVLIEAASWGLDSFISLCYLLWAKVFGWCKSAQLHWGHEKWGA